MVIFCVIIIILLILVLLSQSLGNHEFDDGIEGLLPFVEKANHPVKIRNILSFIHCVFL